VSVKRVAGIVLQVLAWLYITGFAAITALLVGGFSGTHEQPRPSQALVSFIVFTIPAFLVILFARTKLRDQ
jgi:ABC-type Na+ efflux pump permease subunit